MGKGQGLWKKACKIIPGGNMLLSKRAEMFLPGGWPAYFSRTSGCYVWDMDDNRYTDMSIMGIGTNTLGYSHPEVDEAVITAIKAGNMSTLNAPEEVFLAEKLLEIHPFADMARFARSGGEANAIAIRIARAASGKEKVAFCGYHGWHDWYLAANIKSGDELDNHLLPGLEPNGVPASLNGSIVPFEYNDIAALKKIIESGDVGVIKMEVVRTSDPDDGFLNEVRSLATKNGIVLIFDECTSGFRETYGGIHKKYGVEPDVAVFGKALGNGYAVTAVIGKKEVMEAAQTSFISSTFWTERSGSVAALKTLELMERHKSWEQITATGKIIRQTWRQIARRHKLSISIGGIPAISSFSFDDGDHLLKKTFVTQEMLKRGFLASNLIYVSLSHEPCILATYFEQLDEVFEVLGAHVANETLASALDGQVSHGGFKRLN